MSSKPAVAKAPDVLKRVDALTNALDTLVLLWRLHMDERVRRLTKLIVPAATVYVISPIDLIPDFIVGLGQLDDAAIIFLAVTLFIKFCPKDVVAEYRQAIWGTTTEKEPPGEQFVEGTYHEVKE